MSENIYKIFETLRFHYEDETVEFKKAENNFDDTECIEWIIKGLKDHGVLSRRQIDELLWGKLPIDMNDNKKKEKIGNILAKMKKCKKIYFGKDRKWHICDLG